MAATPFGLSEKPSSRRRAFRRFIGGISRNRELFAYFVILSAFLHITLLGSLLVYRGIGEGKGNGPKDTDDFEAFRKALKNMNPMPEDPEKFASILVTITDKDYEEGFERAPKLDDRLTSRERAAVLQALVSSSVPRGGNEDTGSTAGFSIGNILGDYGDRKEFRAPDGAKFMRFGGAAGPPAKYYKLSQESEKRLKSFRNSDHRYQPISSSGSVSIKSDNRSVSVPSEYYYRQAPYERLLAIGARLYYFVEGFPMLEFPKDRAFGGRASSGAGGDPPTETGGVRSGLTLVFLKESKPGAGSQKTASPSAMTLTAENASRILDSLNNYPDETQFEMFRKDYLQNYDADNALLADLTKDFIYKNLGTVFILSDPLSAGFDFLEAVYYRKLTMDGFVSFCLDNQNTRTAAEILFCLAAYYDFERRSLNHLYEGVETAEKALNDSTYALNIFDLRAKAFVLLEVYQEVAAEIRAKGYSGIDAVLQQYREQQAKIYSILMKIGGDVRDRALYSLGALYWDETRVDMALKTWKEISPDFSASPFPKIRGFMALDEPGILEDNIARVLHDEADAAKTQMADRMGKFHKWGKARQQDQ